MSAQGVFTPNLRFTLVEKSSSEVGDETAFPMLVTRDQLAEIFYRVKDAWFTSGSVSTIGYPEEGDPIPGIGMSMEGGDPPSAYISGNGTGVFFIRGYCWWGTLDEEYEPADLEAADAAYFQSPYDGVLIPSYGVPWAGGPAFGTDYLADFFEATYDPKGELCRDVADNERAMWLASNGTVPPRINANTLRTAFSQEMAADGSGSGYLIDHPAPSQLRLEIYPEVAWVDENESGNPFDPLNKLYLKMRFGLSCTATYENVSLDTMPDSGFHSFVEATDLVFELADSTCTAKIYCYSGLDVIEFDSATPFVITAKEWWPYAKASPATAVWVASTGLPV